jgi:hypothetical protein
LIIFFNTLHYYQPNTISYAIKEASSLLIERFLIKPWDQLYIINAGGDLKPTTTMRLAI